MPRFPVQADAQSAAFLEGAARGEFLVVVDSVTGAYLAPQFDASADPDRYARVPASGRATVVSWAVVNERTADGVERIPVGIVQLDEGPWWWTELADADPDADLGGRRACVAFRTFDDGSAVPYFRIEEGAEA
jgi:uncharacterized OB-fold protein